MARQQEEAERATLTHPIMIAHQTGSDGRCNAMECTQSHDTVGE